MFTELQGTIDTDFFKFIIKNHCLSLMTVVVYSPNVCVIYVCFTYAMLKTLKIFIYENLYIYLKNVKILLK